MAEMIKTAEQFAQEQKEISISEFFEKNKHLLGFDNPTKALLMAVKEAVDNSLDAAEEAGILPDIKVKIKQTGEDRMRVSVEDNGPGIVKQQIPRIFGKLLYGSKFHRLRQSRGQQGIGISAVVMYSQLTTGAPTRVWSKTGAKRGHYYELFIDTIKNEPKIVKDETFEGGFPGGHGIKVEFDIVGRFRKTQSVGDYLKQTSIANPFAKISLAAPDGTKITFPRTVNDLPKPPKEMKPHPYGMEFGILQRLLGTTKAKTLKAFLVNEFSSVGSTSAKEVCKIAKLKPSVNPQELTRKEIDAVLGAMQKVKLQRPPLDCLSPIGESELKKSLKKEFPNTELITVITREPTVYRGNPFQIEVGIIYGGDLRADGSAETVRIGNRVPLLYQAGACATIEAVRDVDWKRYKLQQSSGNIPIGPIVFVIHMCSVWVPFVSESKEAIAPYPDIVKEMKLALQDAGRKLSLFISGKRKAGEQKRRMQIFERYSKEVAQSVADLTEKDVKEIAKQMQQLVAKRIKIKDVEEKEEQSDENRSVAEEVKKQSKEESKDKK